ncbi:protein FAM162A [Carettochelys insculpta]|uniref:protein FAM162A n=1 Tax=Carettochelys insculpta TaxID=44489 RepID=UPI003EBC96E9
MWRAATAAAGRATRMLERKVPSLLSPTKGMDLKVKRSFCSKSQEGSKQKPEVGGHPTFRVPGHKPSDWEKKVLLWSGRFKKVDDIPETVSYEMVDAAQNKLRVKISYLMIVLTLLGCAVMVVEGKRAVRRHDSLTIQNMERKARWREEAASSASAKP